MLCHSISSSYAIIILCYVIPYYILHCTISHYGLLHHAIVSHVYHTNVTLYHVTTFCIMWWHCISRDMPYHVILYLTLLCHALHCHTYFTLASYKFCCFIFRTCFQFTVINAMDDSVQLVHMMAEKAHEIFQLFDQENKGFITKKDLIRLENELPQTPEQLEDVFNRLDVHGRGYLTLDEFTQGFGGQKIQFSTEFNSYIETPINTISCYKILHNTILLYFIQYNMTVFCVIQLCLIQYYAIAFNTIQLHSIQYNSIMDWIQFNI